MQDKRYTEDHSKKRRFINQRYTASIDYDDQSRPRRKKPKYSYYAPKEEAKDFPLPDYDLPFIFNNIRI